MSSAAAAATTTIASHLTFNTNSKESGTRLPIDECTPEEAARQLPLQHIWHIWEQVVPQSQNGDYSDNTKPIAKFQTVQDFWRLWNHMPQPSELLNAKRMVREASDGLHLVDALMIFKDGIKPMWEDPLNTRGGHFEYRLRPGNTSGAQIDEYWNNLVLGLIGATVDTNNMITGVRLVDKVNGPRNGGCIRIEVWFTNFDDIKNRDLLKKNIEKCMANKLDGSIGLIPAGDVKSHKHTK